MFDKFGEMDSYKEINELAENLFNEGDTESLRKMAMENGIDEEIAMLYMEGYFPELCDAETAALGKLDMEEIELKPQEIMKDWLEYIRVQCTEDKKLALAVRKKGKSLEDCIAALLKWSFGHQKEIPKKIKEAAGVNAKKVTLGIPGMGQAKKIIREYYLGKKE